MSTTETAIDDALARVEDPELPITLADLGVLRSVEHVDGAVRVRLVPTRLGCPGRDAMVRGVHEAVADVDPTRDVEVIWDVDSWDASQVSGQGRGALAQVGVTAAGDVTCPYCNSTEVRPAGAFGGSLCTRPYTCRSCGATVDALRGALASRGS